MGARRAGLRDDAEALDALHVRPRCRDAEHLMTRGDIDLELGAQTGAGRAGAEGRVEREGPGLDLVDGQGVVVGAGHPLGEAPLLVGLALLAVHEVDEEYAARPESVYSLGKHLEETMAIELTRWHPEVTITALRFSNVMDVEDYAAFPAYDADPLARKWNLWVTVSR